MTKKKLTPEQQKLAADNVSLAAHLAQVVWNRNRSVMDLEEVVAVANLGLVVAAQRWSPDGRDISEEDIKNGKAFAGFARRHILGRILDWQRSQDHVQRSYRSDYKLLVAAGLDNGHTLVSLAEKTKLNEERIRKVLFAIQRPPVYLEVPSLTDNEESYVHDVPDPVDVETSAGERAIMDALVQCLDGLPELTQLVLVMKYYLGMYLNSIEKELDKPHAVISEAHDQGILAVLGTLMENASGESTQLR